ncbi:MAG: thioesterase family protein [Planctomycetaceae bacterium]
MRHCGTAGSRPEKHDVSPNAPRDRSAATVLFSALSSVTGAPGLIQQHTIEVRVRYSETDAMGFVHHSNYLNYFEMGRTELFRQQGGNYRNMELQGLFFVVVKLQLRFRKPARYDDVLTLETQITRSTPARIEHGYRLLRGTELLTEASSVIACVDRNGELQRIPDDLADLTSDA